MKQMDWSLYVLTDRRAAGERALADVVGAAIQGGATAIQLRDKEATTRALVELGRALLSEILPDGDKEKQLLQGLLVSQDRLPDVPRQERLL